MLKNTKEASRQNYRLANQSLLLHQVCSAEGKSNVNKSQSLFSQSSAIDRMLQSFILSQLTRSNVQLLHNLFRRSFCETSAIHHKSFVPSTKDVSTQPLTGLTRQKRIKEVVKHRALALQIKDHLKCTDLEAVNLVERNKRIDRLSPQKIRKKIEFLLKNEVTTKSITENPWLIGVPLSKFLDFLNNIRGMGRGRE